MTNIAQYTVNLLTNIIDSAEKMTIGQMVDEAYLCLLDTSWDLPVRKYTRKAQVIAELQHVISRIGACPAFAERVPDVTPEKRAEHMVHAVQLRGILTGHGIDPQDFKACLDYLLNGAHLRYWVKIYVDYVYEIGYHLEIADKRRVLAVDLEGRVTAVNPEHVKHPGWDAEALRFVDGLPPLGRATVPDASPLVVTSGQAKWLRDQGYGGELIESDHFPPFADEAHIPSRGVPPVGFYQCMGRGIRITKQNARAIHSRANMNTGKANRFPRGKCAARMVELGWEFNEG